VPRATRASMVQRTVCSVVISQSNYLFLDRRLKTALSVKCQFLHQWDSGSHKQNLIHLLFHGHDFTLCCVCQVDFAPVRLGSDLRHPQSCGFSMLPPARAGFQVLLCIHKRKSYFYSILFRDLSIFLTPSSSKRGKRQRGSFLHKEN